VVQISSEPSIRSGNLEVDHGELCHPLFRDLTGQTSVAVPGGVFTASILYLSIKTMHGRW